MPPDRTPDVSPQAKVLTFVPTVPDVANAGCGSAAINCAAPAVWASNAFFMTNTDAMPCMVLRSAELALLTMALFTESMA